MQKTIKVSTTEYETIIFVNVHIEIPIFFICNTFKINNRTVHTHKQLLNLNLFNMLRSVFLKSLLLLKTSLFLIIIGACNLSSQTNTTKHWVGTWATAPQLVEPHNMPPAPGLTNNSLRQVVRVSIGGEAIRLKLSNEFSTSPVTIHSIQIAASTGGHTIDASTNRELTFDGESQITMEPGGAVVSDPVAFYLKPRMNVAITIYYGETSETVTGHPGSRTTSYIIPGNDTQVTDFSGAITAERWYNINRIDVLSPTSAASVAILGNSITDGRGSNTDKQDRWPDILSEILLKNSETEQIGVLNMGIGGNAVLAGGLGPTGLSRYERDILNQPGVKWAIIYHGVNDIGGVRTEQAAIDKANALIEAYKKMISEARERNITIFGATILPFKGNSYYNEHSEKCRETVNDWIRHSGWYDAVIDFDKVMQSPEDPARLVSTFQNDGLHPDAEGYLKMGSSVDINLFINTKQ